MGAKMKVVYPAVFTQMKDKVLVYIPAFKGMTEGLGFADAMEMARDYIANALYDKAVSEYPEQKDNASAKESPFFADGKTVVSFVDVDIDFFRMKEKSRTVRRNITLPEWLDSMADSAHLNVSEITREAIKEALCV